MIKRAGIMFDQVEIESADVPFGIGSGAGVIFGVTGGVTEAVLRKITQGHKRADMEEIEVQRSAAVMMESKRLSMIIMAKRSKLQS